MSTPPSRYATPHPLTHAGTASGLQLLPNGGVLYTCSSLTLPNELYIISDLSTLETRITAPLSSIPHSQHHLAAEDDWGASPKRITSFTERGVEGKAIEPPEYFVFPGAAREVQGWLFKPKGWKQGAGQKWPAALIIHGGKYL